MNAKRKTVHCAALAILVLLGACFAALLVPRFQVAIVAAGFAGYVACTRRALALCRADDLVFDPKTPENWEEAARAAVRAGLVAGSAGVLSLARSGAPRRRRAYPRPLEGTR